MIINVLRVLQNYDILAANNYLPNGVYLLIDSVNNHNAFNYDGPWHVRNGLWLRPTQWQECSPFIPNCVIHVQTTQEVYNISAVDHSTAIICYCNEQYSAHPCYQYVQNMRIVRTSDIEPQWNWVMFALHDETDILDSEATESWPKGKYLLTNALLGQERACGIWHKTDGSANMIRDSYIRQNQIVQVYDGACAGNLYHLYYIDGSHELQIDTLYVNIKAPIIVTYVCTDEWPHIQKQPVLQPGWCVYGPGMAYSMNAHAVGDNVLQINANKQNLFTVANNNELHTHAVCQTNSWCKVDTQILVQNPLSMYHAYRWHCTGTIERVTDEHKPFWRVLEPSYTIQDSYDHILPHNIQMSILCSLLTYDTISWPFESVALYGDSQYLSTRQQSIIKYTSPDGNSRLLRVWHESTGPWLITITVNQTTFSRPPFYTKLHAIGEILVPVLVHEICHTVATRMIYFRNVHQLPDENTDWLHINNTPASIVADNISVLGSCQSTGVSSGSLLVQGGVGINGTIHCGSIFVQSDVRLKQNIRPVSCVMKLIRCLRPKQYDLKGRAFCTGLIAQDVHKIAPQLTHTDHNGILCIDYIAMIPLIIKALQILDNKRHKRKHRRRCR